VPTLVRAFRDMGAMTNPLNIPVVVMLVPETLTEEWKHYKYADLHGQIARAARSAGLEVVDLLGAFRRYPGRRLHISAEDRHPSVLAHRVAAQILHAYLIENHTALISAPDRPSEEIGAARLPE
jgi:hypothetical protein